MLPQLPINIQQRQSQILSIAGINLSDNYGEGSMKDCLNISARRYPYFTTRKGRTLVADYEDVTAVTSWDGLVVVSGTDLYYKGEKVGEVTAGEKQFACINTKIVIMPDKKILDMRTKELSDMAALATFTSNVSTTAPAEGDTEQIMTVTGDVTSLVAGFKAQDVIRVTLGSDVFDLTYEKSELSSGNTKITFKVGSSGNFLTRTYTTGTRKMERRIPSFDYICEANNRIWGCVNEEQTIYASALGDPTNYYDYSGESTDSYAVAVGSAGNFTGCHKLGSSVLFFKEDTLHKVMGDYPSNFTIYSYSMDGVKDGCYKSMQVINELMIYLSRNGVCMYSGGSTNHISEALGNVKYSNGVSGNDGEYYYLSCKDENNVNHLFVMDIKKNMWVQEDDVVASDFASDGGNLYMVNAVDKKLYILNSGSFEGDWFIQFNPMYESVKVGRGAQMLFNKKHFVKLVLRVQIQKGHYCKILYRCDDGRWEESAILLGKGEELTSSVFAINRCDKFEIRLEGTGEFTLMGMARLYMTGSEK